MQIMAVVLVIISLVCFGFGYKTATWLHKPAKPNTTTVTGNIQTRTVTVIKYLPKPIGDLADIRLNIPKPDLLVNVNGQQTTFSVAENEQYLFEKNQLKLDQSSKVSFEVTVKPVDLTKRWGIGVGYNNGLAGIITAPIIGPFDFVGIANERQLGVGALIRF